MSTRRKILLALLILPVGAGIAALIYPGVATEVAFLVLGMPVLVLNAWEFFTPGGLGQAKSRPAATVKTDEGQGDLMRNRNLWISLIILGVFIALIIAYSAIKAHLDGVLFIRVISTLFFTVGRKVFYFVTTPAIFIALLVFGLAVWVLRRTLARPAVAGEDEKETAASYPQEFDLPCVELTRKGLLKRKKAEPWNGEWVDLKTVQLLLEIDGIDVKKPYLLKKVKALEVLAEDMPANASAAQKDIYYWGVMESLCADVLPSFCTVETKDGDMIARFTLKDSMREKLLERLHTESVKVEKAPVVVEKVEAAAAPVEAAAPVLEENQTKQE